MTELIHIISLGAGVQSSTMALMAAHGEITPMPKCAIFADTQGEPQSVYSWLDWLEKQLPYPVYRVSAGNLAERSLNAYHSAINKRITIETIPAFGDKGGLFPRQCTRNFKIAPIRRQTRKLFGRKIVHIWKGISIDEPHRIKPFSKVKCEKPRYPLVELRMKRGDCSLWMKKMGYPQPPRSACVYCPYHSDTEWRRLKDEEPVAFDFAVNFEKKLQSAIAQIPHIKNKPFLHRSCKPLEEVDFANDEDRGQLTMFANDCEGMCGV